MADLGIRRIITTPHLMGSLTHTPERLVERLDEVSQAFDTAADLVGAEYPEVEFRRGHEVMLDVPDVDFSDPRTRLGGSRLVLVEWPGLRIPPRSGEALVAIRTGGYVPIVAHPERYGGLNGNLNLLAGWRDAGAYLQVNYGSLVGRYGDKARETAVALLERGWADYLCSDFHAREDQKIHLRAVREKLEEWGHGETLVQLTVINPGRAWEGEEPLPVNPATATPGVWRRMKAILGMERG
ncbi:MAG: hypothetical protein OEZ37_13680, partial [Gemmatimonadota bacterium]|nr:hypothetical protein [Gemmatimonadota bacterium]